LNHRFSNHAVFPAQLEDCKAAVRWLRANARKYNLDGNHIAAWGCSSGGHLSALLGTTGHVKELEGTGGNLDQSSRVQAVVDWYGSIDLLQQPAPKPQEADSNISRLLGGIAEQNKEKAARANPLTYLTKDTPPFLIMH